MEAQLTLTEKAIAQVKVAQAENKMEGKALRIAVVGGGCSGNSYQLGFDDVVDGDEVFEMDGVKVAVDARSLPQLNGIEVDFVESLQGSSFVFNNPNATSCCGCGDSFGCS